MGEPIEPALSAEEWAAAEIEGDASLCLTLMRADEEVDILLEHAPAVIALLNAMLDPSDPRKITREMVKDLRATTAAIGDRWRQDTTLLDQLAGVLAAYLPPEGT